MEKILNSGVELKDGSKVDIHLWDIERFREWFEGVEFEGDTVRGLKVKGFSSIGQITLGVLSRSPPFKHIPYHREDSLTELEIQENRNLEDREYNRILVGSKEGEETGFLMVKWLKGTNFWRYHIQNVNVRNDLRDKGLATSLYRELDNADFLKNKILQRGRPTGDGQDYLQNGVSELLKARDYALIPHNHCRTFPPEEVGIYDSIGQKIGQSQR